MSGRSASARRLRALLCGCALVLLAVGCTGRQQAPDEYGDTTDKNFNEGCIETLTSESSDVEGEALDSDTAGEVCRCSYDGIVEKIPFAEFKAINEKQSADPGPLDPQILAIVDGCLERLR